jgi:hypothetical protein
MWCAMILGSPATGRNAQGRISEATALCGGGLGTPVRSEIGPYQIAPCKLGLCQALAGTRDDAQASEAVFGRGYAALGTMQART